MHPKIWRKITLSWIFLIYSLFACTSGLANVENTECEKGVSVASGHGVSDIVPIRIGIQKSFGYPWAHRTRCPIGGYFEASAYALNGKKGRYNPNSNKSAQALALAAVLRFQNQYEILAVYPYLDLGLGASWFSKKEIGGRELGIHFEFEDRLGLGFRFGKNQQFDFCYRAVHFSNAYLGQQNHGINLHLLVLGYWFT